MSMMHISLLGPMRVTVDAVTLKSPKRRDAERLWAYLLLRRGQTLARADLAEVLWPDAENAGFLLRHSLHQLQQHLPPAVGVPWLAVNRTTLRWNTEADYWLDVEVFEQQVGQIEPPGDLNQMKAASELYTGPLLDGWDEPWLVADRARLEAVYLTALEGIARAQALAGELPAALLAAGRLLDYDPFREESHRLIMELHVQAGDRVAALHQFTQYGALLAAELGAAPSPELAALAEHIRGQEAASAPAVPGTNGTPGIPDRAEGGPPDAHARLPRYSTVLVGGERVREITHGLAEARLVTVTGAPGSGKSRLAAAAAEAEGARGAFPCGIGWVDLAECTDDGQVAGALAKAFGARAQPNGRGVGWLAPLAEQAAGGAALLVLDNAEHLVAACAEHLPGVLAALADLRILVTSRERLGVGGEQIWRVPLLAVPPGNAVPGGSQSAEAMTLFTDRANRHRPSRLWTREDLVAGAAVCRLLDGLPLALECAAACLARHSPAELATLLAADLTALLDQPLGPDGVRGGHYRTLGEAIAWSTVTLSDTESALLRRLAVFKGNFGVAEAEAVCSGDAGSGAQVPEEAVIDLLDRLVAKSLVASDVNAPASARHRLLGVMAAHGRRALLQTGEWAVLERRAAQARAAVESDRARL